MNDKENINYNNIQNQNTNLQNEFVVSKSDKFYVKNNIFEAFEIARF